MLPEPSRLADYGHRRWTSRDESGVDGFAMSNRRGRTARARQLVLLALSSSRIAEVEG